MWSLLLKVRHSTPGVEKDSAQRQNMCTNWLEIERGDRGWWDDLVV